MNVNEWSVRWNENWLTAGSQRIVISGIEPSWRSVATSFLQGLIMGLVLLNISINDLDERGFQF